MNYNTQINGSRKKRVSTSETASTQRDGNIKSVNSPSGSSKKKLGVGSPKDTDKLTVTMGEESKRSSRRSQLQRESVESPSVSRLKISVDRPIIDQSINLPVTMKSHKTVTKKATPVVQKSSTNSIKNKSKKQYSNNDDKRGISTIYMPKKHNNTAKDISELIKKDRNKSTARDVEFRSGYTNQNSNRPRLPSRERKKSRTLSPSEIKMLKSNVKPSSRILLDNPAVDKAPSQHDSSSECDYEDDFEDYESDFQQCTDSDEGEVSQVSDESEAIANALEAEPIELKRQKIDKITVANTATRKYSDEEHMLDSGHYELHEARRRAARIESISAELNPKPPGLKVECTIQEIKSLPSSADEGFEDGRSGDFAKSSSISTPFVPIITENGDGSSIRKLTKSTRRRLNRGEQLLRMIKLDVVEWSLYESTPIPYDEFILIHGRMNTRQISTQTNDDNVSVEVQTDEIEYRSMWTQFPISCRTVLKSSDDIAAFTAELAGVGSDEPFTISRPKYDILEFNDFVIAAGNIILALLESKQLYKSNIIKDSYDVNQLPFGEARINLSINNVTFLSGRPVTIIRYSDISSKILLTIHDRVDEEVETSAHDDFYITDSCIGCIWNIFQPSRPGKLFYSSTNITACCFHPTNYNIVFAGLEDGSMSLWDLGENASYHRRVIDKENNAEWTLRCVTFNSSGNSEELTQTKIVALTVLSKSESNIVDDKGKFMPLQICSLDEDGRCIVWSVLQNFEGASSNNQDLGQSWWGKLRLMKSYEIPIKLNDAHCENFLRDFRDISVDSVDTNDLYIAENISQVLHVTRFGVKPNPSMYDGIDSVGGTTCIEICPFGQSFFLVGCEDGAIRLYSSASVRPLIQLKNVNSNASIKTIQWSKSKPFTIYVLDDEANIHVWNLDHAHTSPMHSITPDKYSHVISMQLSPWRTNHDMMNQYIALGLDNGTVEIHKFNREYHNCYKDDLTSELEMFFSYLKIH